MASIEVTVHDSIEEVNRNQWNNVVTQSDLGSVFHRYEWLLAVEQGLGYEPRHAVARKNENPIGVFPNFVTAVPMPSLSTVMKALPTDSLADVLELAITEISAVADECTSFNRVVSVTPGYGGPVVTTDEEKCLPLLFDSLADVCDEEVVYQAIRAKETDFVRYGKLLAKRGFAPKLLDCRFEISLGIDFDEIVERMDKERRKALRDVRETDHRVLDLDPVSDAVPDTYRRYVIDMDRVDGHTHPRSFFDAIATSLSDRMKVFAAEVDGEEVGRYVYICDDEQSTLHYLFSAIGDEKNFAHNPSELLHAHAIEWGQERGYRYYDFGSTGSDFRDGTFIFKEKFGGRIIPTLQWEKGYSRLRWTAFKIARQRYQKFAY